MKSRRTTRSPSKTHQAPERERERKREEREKRRKRKERERERERKRERKKGAPEIKVVKGSRRVSKKGVLNALVKDPL